MDVANSLKRGLKLIPTSIASLETYVKIIRAKVYANGRHFTFKSRMGFKLECFAKIINGF